METPQATLEDNAIAYSYDGEQQYFRHPLYPPGIVYTKGVHYIAEHGGAWLIDKIGTMQGRLGQGQRPDGSGDLDMQLWTLWVTEEKTWALTCQDGDYHILWAEGGSYTDFPMDKIDFFVQQNCIMLTSEY
jgi:hypothetical protein